MRREAREDELLLCDDFDEEEDEEEEFSLSQSSVLNVMTKEEALALVGEEKKTRKEFMEALESSIAKYEQDSM